MKTLFATIIINLINILFAGLTLKIAKDCIKEDIKINASLKKIKPNPFEDSRETKIRIKDKGLNKFASIGAFIFPSLILSIIYLMLLDSFYDIAVNFMESKGIAGNLIGGSIAILVFFSGKTFARQFLKENSFQNDLTESENIPILENRMRKIEIAYLSFTFFVILYNYLDFDLKFNIIKAITTGFVAGNIYYVVFRQKSTFNIKSSKSILLDEKDKSEEEKDEGFNV